jgi:hypothetical protein
MVHLALVLRIWGRAAGDPMQAALPEVLWRVAAVGAVPPLERLLQLSLPPLRLSAASAEVLWALPALAALPALLWSPLMGDEGVDPRRLFRVRRLGLDGYGGQLVVALAGGCLGVAAGVLGRPGAVSRPGAWASQHWVAAGSLVLAGCVQELLYRWVVQPVVSTVGRWTGAAAASGLLAFVWVCWIGAATAVPVVLFALGSGFAVARWGSAAGALIGRALFMTALAVLWPGLLR